MAVVQPIFKRAFPAISRRKEYEMTELRILFVCTYNGTRSRIAEEFARRAAPARVEISSASFESEKIGSLAIAVMQEIGIDLPHSSPKSIFERFKAQESYDYVIALCDQSGNELVPIFISSLDAMYGGRARRLNWTIPNFKELSGTDDEKKEKARQIRDRIKTEVFNLLSQLGIDSDNA